MGKHTIFRAAALAVVLMCVNGCGRKPEETAAKTVTIESPMYDWGNVSGRTISVWGRESDLARSYIVRAFERYEDLTGNTVRTVPFTPEQIGQEVIGALEGGSPGMDLLLYFGGANLDSFDPDDNFYDFSDAAWVEDLTDMSINQSIYHGKVIGLPHWEASVSGTLYNKKIFNQYGITPPRTQEEFIQACKILLKNGVTPLYMPGGSPTMLLYQFPMDKIVKDEGTLNAVNSKSLNYQDIPEMYDIVEWYCMMADMGFLGEDYRENDWDGMGPALESGEYAMLLCWDTWLYTDFKGDPADFGLMPAFMGIPDEGTFEGPNLSLLLVNRKGEQVDAALDLITFMADPYNYNDAFQGIYTAPVFRKQMASVSTPQYVESASWIEEIYSDSIAWLNIRGFSQSDASCILDCMSSEGGYTVEQCLKDMDDLRLERMSLYPMN